MPIEGSALPKLSLDTVPEATFYIPATGPATRPRRALKHDNTFAVLDSHGDIGASAGGTDGLFNCDTRFLSHFELLLNGMQPLLLGSNLRDDNTLLTVDLTNPDMYFDDHLVLPKDTLHVVRTIFLWRDTFYQRLAIQNHGDRAVDLRLTMLFDSDFADLFEVRGLRRERRGTISPRGGAARHHRPELRGPRRQAAADGAALRSHAERAHGDDGVLSPQYRAQGIHAGVLQHRLRRARAAQADSAPARAARDPP